MTKDKIRCTMRKKNLEIGLCENINERHNIFNTIEICPEFLDSNSIAIYVSLPDEISTLDIIERWHKMGKRVFLPKIKGDVMDFVEYSTGSLQKGAYGILEPTSDIAVSPSQIELMILPGVAFCSDGRRLGRGKGYYDKYLSQPNFKAYTIGVGFAHQLLDDIPCEAHDVKLSRVVTPIIKSDSQSPSQIIVKVIDAAASAANGLGCGVEKLLSMGLTWVLSRLSIEIYKSPASTEDIRVETWIEEYSRIASTRNFIIKDSSNETVAIATSQWCIIDMKARRPVDFAAVNIDYSTHIKPRDIKIDRPRKIAQLDSIDGELSSTQHTVTELDIDINHHVNTMRYIDMIFSEVDNSLLKTIRIDLHFINESTLGDRLTINHKKQPQPNGLQLLFEIIRPDGSPSVRALLTPLNES